MINLYKMPLGNTARNFFQEEANKQYNKEETLLILPSRLLVGKSRNESSVRAVNFEYLPNQIIELNWDLLKKQVGNLPEDSNLIMISRRTQELLVEDLLNQLSSLNGLDYFANIFEKKGFIRAVTSLIGELSRSGAEQEEIVFALRGWEERNPSYSMKDEEIAALYTLYRNKLRLMNWYDLEGVYRLAILVLENESAIIPWKHLYFSEFYNFDNLQRLFLRKLSNKCNVSIGLVYDVKRPEIFGSLTRTYGELSGFATQVRDLEFFVERTTAINHLVSEIFKDTTQKLQTASGIDFIEANTNENELRAILRSVKVKLQCGNKCDEIAIVLRDFQDYSGIRAICDEYGLPVSLPKTVELSSQPLIEFFTLILKVKQSGSESIDAYWQLLKCGLVKLKWHFNGEKINCLKQKQYYGTQEAVTAAAEKNVREQGNTAQEDFCELTNILNRILEKSTVFEYGELFKEILLELNLLQILGSKYHQAEITLLQIKNLAEVSKQFVEVLDTISEDYRNCGMQKKEISSSDFAKLLLEACSERQIVLEQADSNGLLIGEASNLQGLYFKHVYIMGVKEGQFPKSKNESWVYGDAERTYLSGVGIELDNTAIKYAEDKFFFASVIAMATESLTISWVSDDTAGASPYIQDIERVFAQEIINKTKFNGVYALEDALSEIELTTILAKRCKEHEWLVNSLDDNWILRSNIEDIRKENFDRFSGVLKSNEIIKSINTVIGSNFSASRLETYAQCPFRFLLSYVWSQDKFEEKTEVVEPVLEGNILHDVLAKFMTLHLNRKLCTIPKSELEAQIDDIMTSVCKEYINSSQLIVTDFWPSQKRSLSLILQGWLERELEYQEQWEGFVPKQVEWDFGRNDIPPLQISIGEDSIYLNGRIDRIDSNGNGLFVTDYKRSQTPSSGELASGLDLQIPIYLLAMAELEQDKTILGGGYYSLKEGKRKGGFALKKMPKPPFTVNNKPFSEEEDQWASFAQACKNLIKEYVNNMRQGKYQPSPRKQCPDHCPGKDICRRYGQLEAESGENDV